MMQMGREDYHTHYWPKLERAINQLLTYPTGKYPPISFEEMYSCVYKCVCKQLADRLHADLFAFISQHLHQVSGQLQNLEGTDYIEAYNAAMNLYIQAVGLIVKIFTYMDRFYVESKLKTDLQSELLQLFITDMVDPHIGKLIPVMQEAQSRPFSVSPPVMANLVKGLHSLQPELANMAPVVFARFIPNILPPMIEADLPVHAAESRYIQEQLLRQGFTRGDQSRKRPGEDISQVVPQHSSEDNHNSIRPDDL